MDIAAKSHFFAHSTSSRAGRSNRVFCGNPILSGIPSVELTLSLPSCVAHLAFLTEFSSKFFAQEVGDSRQSLSAALFFCVGHSRTSPRGQTCVFCWAVSFFVGCKALFLSSFSGIIFSFVSAGRDEFCRSIFFVCLSLQTRASRSHWRACRIPPERCFISPEILRRARRASAFRGMLQASARRHRRIARAFAPPQSPRLPRRLFLSQL